jgi:hypothetical protein|tara:strand:+ start:55 stop:1011 length:957 start_codon:yes stop_codon:yes gene_type:complete
MAVTETRSLPPQFVEDLGKDYAKQLTGLTSLPLDTKKFQPMVAGQDQAQKDAYSMATTQGQGIGSFQPYLQQAGAFQQGTGTFAGQPANMMGSQDYLQAAQAQSTAQGALSGPNAYKQFMSPYQQDVINATMTDYDKQAAKGMTSIGQNAAMSGNLGGGREGVMRAEYKNQSDMNRALLQGKMLQQGFGQAQGQANTAFGQQGNLFSNQQNLMQGANTLGADQQRMASLVPGLYGQDVQTLQGAGTNQQLQSQNILDQQREANRMAAYEPYERLNYMGAGMGNVMGSAMGQYQTQVSPNKSALETAIGIGSLGYGMTK